MDNDNKIVYFTDKLSEKLKNISRYPVTLLNAPTGYGKTTILKEYVYKSPYSVSWINVFTNSKHIFWNELCDNISEIDNSVGTQLLNIGFPNNENDINEIRKALKNISCNEKCFVVIDNVQRIIDDNFILFFSLLAEMNLDDIHFILISQDNIMKNTTDNILSITKEDLTYNESDIIQLFNLHGLSISPEDAHRLHKYTEGWICAIYLQMQNYIINGSFDSIDSLDELVEKTVWGQLKNEEKNILLMVSEFDYFTLKELSLIFGDGYNSTEIESFINKFFFIRFERSDRKYYIHHLFLSFLRNEFKLLSDEERNEMAAKIGSVYKHRGDYVSAFKKYYEVGDWEAIYNVTPKYSDLYRYLTSDNKNFFISLISECPQQIKDSHPYFSIIMCIILFMYNEKQRLTNTIMDIVYSLEDNDKMPEEEKNKYYSMVYYIRGYTSFNDIDVMHDFFKKSLEYGDAPVISLTSDVIYTLGIPSVFNLFHREDDIAESENDKLENMLLSYYKLSEGHGKGSGALFKAEMLFNSGNYEAAETLCHKAIYMADSRNQTCISLGALLLLARISTISGDVDAFEESVAAFRKKTNDPNYCNMIEMCEGYMYSLIDVKEKIPEWLKDYTTIEKKLNVMAISYANIIYGKYLLLNGEFQKFLGISSQFIGVASLFNQVMPKIYTYIYIAIANFCTGNKEKAIKINTEAIELAIKDNIIMPFLENMEMYEEIFDEINYPYDFRSFIKKLKAQHKKYIANTKSLKKSAHHKENFGLTQREYEVAKLAAKRLSNKEIAEELYIAESTVKSNMKIIFSKLGINARTELSNYFK